MTTNAAIPEADPKDLDDFLGVKDVGQPWYRRKAVLAGLAALVVVIVILMMTLGGSETGGFATEAAKRRDITVTISATGNLQPTNKVDVGSEQSGLVDAVYVDNNDRVVRGQPLARLDPSRLRDTLIQNQASLAATKAQVAQGEASATQARASLSRLEEVWRLSGGQVPARTELDTARAEDRRTQAVVQASRANVRQVEAQVSSAATNLSKATIYSPVTGVVLSRAIDPGQTVAASLQAPVLFTLAEDLAKMDLEVKVDEADVGQVKEGQRASFTVDAYPGRQFTASIRRVDLGANASDDSTAANSVVAYTAVLGVENPELLLRPGMTATAEIVTSEKKNVLTVPNAALRFTPSSGTGESGGGLTSMLMPRPRGSGSQQEASIGRGSSQTVYILDADGQPKARKVTVGESNGSVTEITGGQLKAGEQIITGQLAAGASSGEKSPSTPAGQRAQTLIPATPGSANRRYAATVELSARNG